MSDKARLQVEETVKEPVPARPPKTKHCHGRAFPEGTKKERRRKTSLFPGEAF